MKRLTIIALLLVFGLPIAAQAQGKRVRICAKKRFHARQTVTENFEIVFGSDPDGERTHRPGNTLAPDTTLAVFGADAGGCHSGAGCPTGAVSVDCTTDDPAACVTETVPQRHVYAVDGGTDGKCLAAAPAGGSPLGDCCVCRWRRQIPLILSNFDDPDSVVDDEDDEDDEGAADDEDDPDQ